jgi:glutaredoxin
MIQQIERRFMVVLQNRLITLCGLGTIAGLTLTPLAGCTPTPSSVAPTANVATAPLTFEQKLATHLQNIGAKMYGAHWCPYCRRQKELFRDAASQVPYVECDPTGQNAQPQMCAAKGLEGYPTWEINGKLYPGQRSLQELADISNLTTTTSQSAPVTTNP